GTPPHPGRGVAGSPRGTPQGRQAPMSVFYVLHGPEVCVSNVAPRHLAGGDRMIVVECPGCGKVGDMPTPEHQEEILNKHAKAYGYTRVVEGDVVRLTFGQQS